ncbi:MAG: hypothetical protein ABFE07_29025 [Armatimonadia bacterium]
MPRSERLLIYLKIPREQWALLLETLTLDARSSAFDPKLRRRIARALKTVRYIGMRKD